VRGAAPAAEIEAKLTATRPSVLAAIARRRALGTYRLRLRGRARLYSVYLDTADRALARHRIARRLRRRGRQWAATVKWSGTVAGYVHTRPELNVELLRPPTYPFTLPVGPLRKWLSARVARRPLAPILITDIERETIDVFEAPRRRVLTEIALDRVRIKAPGEARARASYGEVEVELRHGTRADLHAVSEQLREAFALTPSPDSKSPAAWRSCPASGRASATAWRGGTGGNGSFQ
jgi:inorganic triphosphatase YgiF